MTVDPSSLLTVSIGTLLVVLATVVSAAVTWTRLTGRLDAFGKEMRAVRGWAHEQVSDVKADHAELHDKHHELRDQVQEHEVRFAAHGIHAGSAIAGRRMPAAPRRTVRDPTPPPVSIRSHEDSGPEGSR